MVKKGVLVVVVFFVIFSCLNFFSVYYLDMPLSPVTLTGRVVTEGILNISIEQLPAEITIYSPLNQSYDFEKGVEYIIALNVSASDLVENWMYSLYDLRNGVYAEEDTPFSPNSSIIAVRWENILIVKAHQVDAGWIEKNVTFYVNINNSEPELGDIPDEIFGCEGESFLYYYNATDADREALTSSISYPNPFFERYVSYDDNVTTFFKIISGKLDKDNAGGVGGISKTYERTISVWDELLDVDSADVNITIIEINNVPVINNGLGAQTVYLQGDNSTFYHQVDVTDIEDGGTEDGSLEFNLSFEGISNVFEIDSLTGIMNYTPTMEDNGSVFSLTVCVEDNALVVAHENFSVCSDKGYTSDANSACDEFTLTVTSDNRAPQIVDYYPSENFSAGGMSSAFFNVSVYDADGTIPDIDWYVDGALIEHNENMSNDSFSYFFGCGVEGLYNIEIVTSDGLANDSHVWGISVSMVECVEDVSGGSGGGSSGIPWCFEDWACRDWEVCQNVKRSFESEVLSPEDYSLLKGICEQNNYDERFCGFQVTACMDINACNNSEARKSKPSESQICYFTENPSCGDGITNCHNGACELFVDCGGPCSSCPTCSDNIRNQGEADVDCGGPCPYLCEEEMPMDISIFMIILLILFILIIIVILVKAYKIWKYERSGR
ncbi:MAG: hypothetical protein ABIF18_02425 [archaeon]